MVDHHPPPPKENVPPYRGWCLSTCRARAKCKIEVAVARIVGKIRYFEVLEGGHKCGDGPSGGECNQITAVSYQLYKYNNNVPGATMYGIRTSKYAYKK